ncbi:MAG: hypothetical protein ACTHMP_16960 [Thermomicrobiales bacterium]
MDVRIQRGDLGGIPAYLAQEQQRLVAQMVAGFAEVFVRQAREFAPSRSGHLRDTIAETMQPDGVLIEATAPYALYVLTGVRPHYMDYLVGRTVAFTARDGTRVVRRVTRVGEWDGRRHWWHPGTPARDFFRQAWESGPVHEVVDALAQAGVSVTAAFLYGTNYAG